MKFQVVLAGAIGGALVGLLGMPHAAANTVYAVHDADRPNGFDAGLLVDGSITTDGKIGVLDQSDIIGWNFSLSGFSLTPVTLTEINSIIDYRSEIGTPTNLAATSGALLWDWSSPSEEVLSFDLQIGNFSADVVYDATGNGFGVFIIFEKFFLGCCDDPVGEFRADTQAIATATPLPATLPLFLTGLGALGLLGWHSKKKVAVAI